MTKLNRTLILLIALVALVALIAASCAPAPADVGGSASQTITGTLSYEDISEALGSEISVGPTRDTDPYLATIEFTIAPELPSGLALDDVTGYIRGTPDAEFASTDYVVTVTGTGDYSGTIRSDSFSITITEAGIKTIDGSTISYLDIYGTAGVSLSASQTSTIPAEANVEYTIDPALSGGLTFSSSTGEISGTPNAAFTTSHVVTATATGDYTGTISSDSFTITIIVIDDKTIDGSTISYLDIYGTAGVSLSASQTSTIPAEATVEYTIDPALSGGLTFSSSTGEISGTPNAAFATSHVVTATATGDYTGSVSSDSFSINITVEEDKTIDGSTITYQDVSATVGIPLSAILQSTIPTDAPVEYTIDPALPEGLTFSGATGEISGIPNAASTTNHVVMATATGDYTGSVSSNSFSIIIEINKTIDGSTLMYLDISGTIGVSLSASPTDTFPVDASVEYTIDPALSGGLIFSSSTGEISGIPDTESATFHVVTATATGDYTGSVSSDSFSLTIERNRNIDGSTITYQDIPGTVDIALFTTVTSTIPADAPVEYTVDPELPAGLVLIRDTGQIVGIPTTESITSHVITATAIGDYTGSVTSNSFSISIEKNKNIDRFTLTYRYIYGAPGNFLSNTPTSTVPSEAAVRYTINPALPTGLMLNPDTGEIRGTPVAEFALANFIVTATATGDYTGSVSSDDLAIIITINKDIDGAAITYQDIPGVEDISLSEIPTIAFAPEATVEYTIDSALPAGLTLNSDTGEISGTPLIASASTDYVVTATASGDYTGIATSNSFAIAVASNKDIDRFTITYREISGSVNTFLSVTPTSTVRSEATVEHTIDIALPSGLTLNPDTGEISGIPLEASVSTDYVVTATGTGDYTGSTSSDSFTIVIDKASLSRYSFSYESSSTDINEAISLGPTSSIPTGATIEYSLDPAGPLPAGVTFDSDSGIISGTPDAVFSFSSFYRVTATGTGNYEGTLESNPFTIAVNAISLSKYSFSYESSITRIRDVISLGPTTTIPATATVGYAIEPTTLPAGVTFDPNDGTISGTPTDEYRASFFYRVTVTGSGDYTSTIQSNYFEITVTKISILGLSTFYGSYTTDIGETVSIIPVSNIPADATVEYVLNPSRLPEGVTFDPNDGTISGVPTASFVSNPFKVRVTGVGDYSGVVLSNDFNILITKVLVEDYDVSYESFLGNIGDTISLVPTSNIPAVATVEYTLSPSFLPDGVTFDSTSGIISGVPTTAFRSIDYEVEVIGSGGYTGVLTVDPFTFEITRIPVTKFSIVYDSSSTNVGEDISLVPRSDIPADATVRYFISSGLDLPYGVRLNPNTGVISGAHFGDFPATDYTVEVVGSDDYEGRLTSRSFTIVVSRISIEGTVRYEDFESLLDVTVDLLPTVAITPTTVPVTYEISSGILPNELLFDRYTGRIYGSIDRVVNVDLQVTATATSGVYGGIVVSNEFSITINPLPISGSFEYASETINRVTRVRGEFAYIIVRSSITPPDATVRYEQFGSLPEGLSVNAPSGNIQGTPTETTDGSIARRVKVFGTGRYGGEITSSEVYITIIESKIELNNGNSVIAYPFDNSADFGSLPGYNRRNYLSFRLNHSPEFFETSLTGVLGTIERDDLAGSIEFSISPALGTGRYRGLYIDKRTGAIIREDSNVPFGSTFDYQQFVVTVTGKNAYAGTVTQEIFIENVND